MHKMTAERPKYRYIERHPRLNSFFESTTMSVTTMMLALTSVIWYYSDIAPAATVAMAVLGAFMLGYTIWYWTGHRKSVRKDKLISELTSYYVYLEMARIPPHLPLGTYHIRSSRHRHLWHTHGAHRPLDRY